MHWADRERPGLHPVHTPSICRAISHADHAAHAAPVPRLFHCPGIPPGLDGVVDVRGGTTGR